MDRALLKVHFAQGNKSGPPHHKNSLEKLHNAQPVTIGVVIHSKGVNRMIEFTNAQESAGGMPWYNALFKWQLWLACLAVLRTRLVCNFSFCYSTTTAKTKIGTSKRWNTALTIEETHT